MNHSTPAQPNQAQAQNNFHSIYSHGFIRASVCIPLVRVAAPYQNCEGILRMAKRASESSSTVALFPELGMSAYSNEDLFHQDALLDATVNGISQIAEASRNFWPILIVGAPLRLEGKLFNCAVVIYRGEILGITPKSYLPNYREFYEKRQFTSGIDAVAREVSLLGQQVPFGNDLMYEVTNIPGLELAVEICEDLWAPIPVSTYAALAGATVLANLSASNITIGKAEYRRSLCASQSGRCIAAYLYAAAGAGESTTDLAWDGHAMIFENHELLAESDRFAPGEQLIIADIDLDRLIQERMRMTSFNDCVGQHQEQARTLRRIPLEFQIPQGSVPLKRKVEQFPYVPSEPAARDERCREAYNIQVQGLTKRLDATGIKKVVIGVSGGLDSTQALIVACKSIDRLGLPRANVLGYTMPGFATSESTRKNALALMKVLGVTTAEIDIRPSCTQMLKDIDHPFARGERVYDVTFENVQAGERTSHLFRLANLHNALVVGTGDLSELALGWCTYGVGDQMAHYSVNASVPKTLIQHLIRWVISSEEFDRETSAVLQQILDTQISPELVPGGGERGSQPAQRTEDTIGPFELQDFNLYYISRYGYRPSKVAFLAHYAWGERKQCDQPSPSEGISRHYSLPTIKKWLEVFLYRFFNLSQFKRSCLPNTPKVGSGGSLSPRSDWRAPADVDSDVWIRELREGVPDV
jgi:NAD+ synthase (glutamine-hydrolysing)